MRIDVHNNNVERALRVLNKKLKEEGFWDEYKRHRFFEKPSVIKRRKRLNKQFG